MSFEDFRQLVSELTRIPINDIQEQTSFREDLAIDSLQMVNLIVEVTSRWNVALSDLQSIYDIDTVKGFYSALQGE